jgi:hypothetical protein
MAEVRSCPYRHMPASRRRESRAARPAHLVVPEERRARAMDCARGAEVGVFLWGKRMLVEGCGFGVFGGERSGGKEWEKIGVDAKQGKASRVGEKHQ